MGLSSVFDEEPLHPVPLQEAVAQMDREADRFRKGYSIAAYS